MILNLYRWINYVRFERVKKKHPAASRLGRGGRVMCGKKTTVPLPPFGAYAAVCRALRSKLHVAEHSVELPLKVIQDLGLLRGQRRLAVIHLGEVESHFRQSHLRGHAPGAVMHFAPQLVELFDDITVESLFRFGNQQLERFHVGYSCRYVMSSYFVVVHLSTQGGRARRQGIR